MATFLTSLVLPSSRVTPLIPSLSLAMAAPFLLALLLLASGDTAAGDDGAAALPHLQLPGILDAGRGHGSDAPPLQGQLMDIMSMSGCGRFAALVAATPIVSDVFQVHIVAGGAGLTVFCPDDKAVDAFEPKFHALPGSDQVNVLLYHGAPARYVREQLAGFGWVAVPTLAPADAATNEKQTLLVRDRGNSMRLWLGPTWPRDGLSLARVTTTVSSEEALLILHVVDAVLLRRKLDVGDEAAACGGKPWLVFCIIPILAHGYGRIVTYLILAEHGGGKGKIVMAAIVLLGLLESRAYLQRTSDLGRGHNSDAPPPQGQLMEIMSASGCGRFAALVAATPNVSGIFQEKLDADDGGLMVFCPDDKAVAAFEPTFQGLADSDRLDLLLHHAADARYVRAQLADFDWVAVRTLAVADAAQTILVRDRGDDMELWLGPTWPRDGLGLARVTNTVSSSESEAPLILHVVDAVLLRQKKLDGGDDEAAAARGWFPSWQELRCGIIPFCTAICVVLLIRIVGHLFWPEYARW